jgi:4a-hydroxytetrahydrobiopterin dehydratase
MTELTQKKCVPCEIGGMPVKQSEAGEFAKQLNVEWQISYEAGFGKRMERKFKFKDFVEAMKFVNEIATLAEEEGHHPDFHVHYNEVRIELWTHAVGGLSENDFIVAAKIDQL